MYGNIKKDRGSTSKDNSILHTKRKDNTAITKHYHNTNITKICKNGVLWEGNNISGSGKYTKRKS